MIESASLLLLQLLVILAVTTICGWLATRLRQPRVVGEITGGLLMGSLLLGHLFPSASAFVFSGSRLHPLNIVSSVGLVLFLFLMGQELDLDAVRDNRGASIAITAGSIGLPFLFGAALAPALLMRFGVSNVSRLGFVLFLGIAMSITAMPVLARILQDRRQAGRPVTALVGSTAMICAAANDLLGWALLAVTLSILHGSHAASTALRLVLLPIYLAIMLFVVRPLVRRWLEQSTPPVQLWLPAVIAFAFASSRITDSLGIHAFLGAFLAGICMPRIASVGEILHRTLLPIIRITLPVFFAMNGLRMQREAFSSHGLEWLGVILLVAVLGKIGGSLLGARIGGMPWKESTQIGILLNTRGLVELIVLNIGYREGILSPILFTLFVLMAVITTVMTAPLFDLTTRNVSPA